jgi:hypothetical protein
MRCSHGDRHLSFSSLSPPPLDRQCSHSGGGFCARRSCHRSPRHRHRGRHAGARRWRGCRLGDGVRRLGSGCPSLGDGRGPLSGRHASGCRGLCGSNPFSYTEATPSGRSDHGSSAGSGTRLCFHRREALRNGHGPLIRHDAEDNDAKGDGTAARIRVPRFPLIRRALLPASPPGVGENIVIGGPGVWRCGGGGGKWRPLGAREKQPKGCATAIRSAYRWSTTGACLAATGC